MDRKDFINSIGLSAAGIALASCLGCKKDSNGNSADTIGPSGIDFTIDLSLAANAALKTNGGYLISNGVLIARTITGDYIAIQRSCTHESYSITYQPTSKQFYCPNHGATFTESGAVSNGPASRSLKTYITVLTGTSLRIYS